MKAKEICFHEVISYQSQILIIAEESRVLLQELDALIGLKDVKDFVHKLHDSMVVQNARRAHDLTEGELRSLHMIFKGASGTGMLIPCL